MQLWAHNEDVASTGSMSRLRVVHSIDITNWVHNFSHPSQNGHTYAEHSSIGKVRVKQIKPIQSYTPDIQKSFWATAYHLLDLKHENLTEFLGVVATLSSYLVTSVTQNGTVSAVLKANPGMNRVKLILGAAKGVAFLHQHEITHGDIRADNIHIDEYGTPKFDILEPIGDTYDWLLERNEYMDNIGGNTRWSAPEVFYGTKKNHASDVFAFGMTMYEILSGKLPYDWADTPTQIHDAIKNGRRPTQEPIASKDGQSYLPLWNITIRAWSDVAFTRPTMSMLVEQIQKLEHKDPSNTVLVQAEVAREPDEVVISLDSLPVPKHMILTESVKFSSDEPIAAGGFCDVYYGEYEGKGQVALKVTRVRGDVLLAKQRLWTEIEMWSAFQHENVLALFGLVEKAGHIYTVSPWQKQGTLLQFVREHQMFDRVKLLTGAARGISYLHGKGIVHGDIKGANIVISDEGIPLVIDFGLSKHTSGVVKHKEMEGHLTLRWSSPELLNGGIKTFSSDVYAFAMTISETLSGYIPFKRIRAQAAVVGAVLRGERPEQRPAYSPGRNGYTYGPIWKIASDGWTAESSSRPTIDKVLERLEEIQLAVTFSTSLDPEETLEDVSIKPSRSSICDSRASTERSHWSKGGLRWVSAKFKGIGSRKLTYDDDVSDTMTTGHLAKINTTTSDWDSSMASTTLFSSWNTGTKDLSSISEI